MSYYNEKSYKAANTYKKKNIKRVPLDMQIEEYECVKAAAEKAVVERKERMSIEIL